MRIRRAILAVAGIAALAMAATAVWDFTKFGRAIPPMMPKDQLATSILVEKSARRLTLLRDGKSFKTYQVSLGTNPLGHKQQEGDRRTPEGAYAIDFKNARSRFHLALRVSYPNAADRDAARRQGVSPGGDIMIHGLPNGLGWVGKFHLSRDWTDGCAAVTNRQIEEIWSLVDVGTRVEIRP